MILLYGLAAMWSIGCVILPLWAFAHLTFLGDDFDRMPSLGIASLLIGFPIGVVFAIVPWGLMADAKSPDLITLKKNAWHCNAGHNETTMILVGKVMVPQTHFVCDQYGKI